MAIETHVVQGRGKEATKFNSTGFKYKSEVRFTPGATDNYIVFANMGVEEHASTDHAGADLQIAGVQEGHYQVDAPEFTKAPAIWVKRKSIASGAERTVRVGRNVLSTSYDYSINGGDIVVWNPGTEEYAENDSLQTETSTSYVDKLTLTFTPGSTQDYLIFATAEAGGSNTADSTGVALDIDGTTEGEDVWEANDGTDFFRCVSWVKRINLDNTEHDIKLQLKNLDGTTASIRNARIVAIPLSAVTNYYSATDSEVTETSTSFVDAKTFSPTLNAGKHLILATAEVSHSSTGVLSDYRLTVNGTDPFPNYASVMGDLGSGEEDYQTIGWVGYLDLNVGSNEFSIEWKTASGTAKMKRARISVLEMPAPDTMWRVFKGQSGQSSDDAEIDETADTISLTDTSAEMGDTSGEVTTNAMVIPNVRIESAADTIIKAHMDMQSSTTQSNTVNDLRVEAYDEDDTATLSTYANHDARARTTANVDWDALSSWSTDDHNDTPDLTAVIQEVIDRGGWSEGNSIGIVIKDNGSSTGARRSAKQWDSDGSGQEMSSLYIEQNLLADSAPTITKSLKYTILITPATITKSLKYNIDNAPIVQKSLKYTVKTTVFQTLDQFQVLANEGITFGRSGVNILVGQQFTPSTTKRLSAIATRISKIGTPTDNMTMELWSLEGGGDPDVLLATSETVVDGATLAVWTSTTLVNFLFRDANITLQASTKYAFVLRRSGASDASDYYVVLQQNTNPYAGGLRLHSVTGSGWTQTSGTDLFFGHYYVNDANWKQLRYYIATQPTIQKSLKYVVDFIDEITITKNLEYTVVSTPSAVTKSLKYTVLVSPPAVTKTLEYFVLTTPSAVTKSLHYEVVSTPTALTKSLKYVVVATPTAKTKSLKYAVISSATIQKSLKYTTVITPTALTKSLHYEVVAPLTIGKSLKYIVVAPASVTRSLKYTVISTPSVLTKSLKYNIDNAITLQKSLKYTVVSTPESCTEVLNETMVDPPTAGTLNGTAVHDDANDYIRLTTATNDTQGSYTLGSVDIDSGIISTEFEWWAGGGNGADAVVFLLNTTGTSGNEETGDGGYRIYYSEYNGIIGIRYNGSLIASSPESPDTFDDSTWRTGKIVVNLDTFLIKVFINGVLRLEYQDTSRTFSGSIIGWGARTGGANNEHRIRNLILETCVPSITKSLQYTVISSPTISKSLEYRINIGSTILTKSLDYFVDISPAATTKSLTYEVQLIITINKSLTYSVLITQSLSKSLKYTILTTPAVITKSLHYEVLTENTVNKSLKYTVITPVSSLTLSQQYAVLTANTVNKSLKYTILTTPTAVTKSLKYTIIVTGLSITKDLIYSVLTSATITKSLTYEILTFNSITKGLVYSVITDTTITKSLRYSILVPATIVKSLDYRVVTIPTITKSLTYEVITAITKSLHYEVLTELSIVKSLTYEIDNYTEVRIDEWETIFYTTDSVTKSLRYEVLTNITVAKSLTYHILQITGSRKRIYIRYGQTIARLKYVKSKSKLTYGKSKARLSYNKSSTKLIYGKSKTNL